MKTEGKVALITGAARGIGLCISDLLASKGADVICIDLDVADKSNFISSVEKYGRKATFIEGNLCSEQDTDRFIQTLFEKKLSPDILINNAGVTASGLFDEEPWEKWEKILQINLFATMRFTYKILPLLKKKKEAHIVNLSSVAGKFGPEGLAAYAASKHGIVGFSSSLRCELMDENIGVSWVCPIFVKTRMTEGFHQTFFTQLISPEKVARETVRAIEKNYSEVYIPKSQWILAGVLASIFPGLARIIATKFKLNGNLKDLRKDIPPELNEASG